jgi:uncharacterized membrane protein YbjE (DUF340 family)
MPSEYWFWGFMAVAVIAALVFGIIRREAFSWPYALVIVMVLVLLFLLGWHEYGSPVK